MKYLIKIRTITFILFFGILSTTGISCQSDENQPAQNVDNVKNQPVQIEILVKDQKFIASLIESETTTAFLKLLPHTFIMSDLNSNEKFIDLPQNLPQNASNPGTIQVGDVMLWGSNTLVVFYKSFSTSYPYTRLGKVADPEELVQALGEGNVEVTFQIK